MGRASWPFRAGAAAEHTSALSVLRPSVLIMTTTARLAQGSPWQGSFEDLGTPLREVTFVVVDLETTGGSAHEHQITEIGAVKVRGGECL